MSESDIILDTDIGYDPDDIFALALLDIRASNRLKLVVTADEIQGKRTRLVRKVLRELGNRHTQVIAGMALGLENFVADELIQDETEEESAGDFVSTITDLAEKSDCITYISIGGFTNLARLIRERSELRDKMNLFVMGGAMDYSRGPGWIEHNVRIDISSAKSVIESGWDLTMVMAQTTFHEGYEIGKRHPILKELEASSHPAHQIIARHCHLWFDAKGYTTKMHDPLTVATALGDQYTLFHEDRVVLDDGILHRSENGGLIRWSDTKSESGKFMNMMRTELLRIAS